MPLTKADHGTVCTDWEHRVWGVPRCSRWPCGTLLPMKKRCLMNRKKAPCPAFWVHATSSWKMSLDSCCCLYNPFPPHYWLQWTVIAVVSHLGQSWFRTPQEAALHLQRALRWIHGTPLAAQGNALVLLQNSRSETTELPLLVAANILPSLLPGLTTTRNKL